MAGSNNIDLNPEVLAAAAESKAWPFEEARKIVERYKGTGFPETVLFETGYGPSGLPHIGTFGEVARTSMVRHAFRVADRGTRSRPGCLCFSDDMDGMRKIPDNVPDRAVLEPHLHKPLTVGAQSVRRRLCELRATTTTRCCAASSTRSASTTSSPARRNTTSPAVSTRCCCAPPNATTRSWR